MQANPLFTRKQIESANAVGGLLLAVEGDACHLPHQLALRGQISRGLLFGHAILSFPGKSPVK